ncbi:hypothetical protein M3591_13465 [Exiguobacterium sp. MER 193]|uniref:hypothetical protein n=1 Tax=Exiguobacterium sp. MER 193 TaxID=2939564 RepID=UPI00203C8252|nr:hypothetical protein [Exiguobacterium sp. MER 193]MCM3281509.1 hypothetical protein [Exiguobacterium sp. MER 193]
MPKVNGKIYYNLVTGDVLLFINQNEDAWIVEKTLEQDIASHNQLQAVDKNVIGLIRLQWDQYKDELSVSDPVKVDKGKVLWRAKGQLPTTQPEESFTNRIKELEAEKEMTSKRLNEAEDMIIMLTMLY